MFGQILSGKVLAAVLAGAVVTGGAATVASSTDVRSGQDQTTAAQHGEQQAPVAETGKGNGQGSKISALAKSIPGGPGKGAQISAAAKGHGQAVSAAAKKNANGKAKE